MKKIAAAIAALVAAGSIVTGAPASAAPVHPFAHAHKHLSCLRGTYNEYRKGCPLVPIGATPPPMPGHHGSR